MPRKTFPLLWLVAGLVLIAIVGSYLILPAVLERLIAGRLQEQLGLRSPPEVELQSEPLPALPGRFSEARVSMQGAEFDGVRTSTTEMHLGNFRLDLPGSIAAAAPRLEEPLSGTLRVELPEEEVARLARQEAGVPVRSVDLREGSIVVGSLARGLGVEVPLSVRGDLSLRDGALIFEPRGLSAAGVPLGEELGDRLLSEASFEYTLEGLPYGAEITGAEVQEGRLVLNGEVEHVRFGGGNG